MKRFFRAISLTLLVSIPAFLTGCDGDSGNYEDLVGGGFVDAITVIGFGLQCWGMYDASRNPSPQDLQDALVGLSTRIGQLGDRMDEHFTELDERLDDIDVNIAKATGAIKDAIQDDALVHIEAMVDGAEADLNDWITYPEDSSYADAIYDRKLNDAINEMRKRIFTGSSVQPSGSLPPLIESIARAEVFDARNARGRPEGCGVPCTRRSISTDDSAVETDDTPPLEIDPSPLAIAYRNMAALFANYTFLEFKAAGLHHQALKGKFPDKPYKAEEWLEDFTSSIPGSSSDMQDQCDAFIHWVEYLVLNSIDWQDRNVASGRIPERAQNIFRHADLLVAKTLGRTEYGVRGRKIYLRERRYNPNIIRIQEAEGVGDLAIPSGLFNTDPASAGIDPDPHALYSEAVNIVPSESPKYDPFSRKDAYVEDVSMDDPAPPIMVHRESEWTVVRLRAALAGQADAFEVWLDPIYGDPELEGTLDVTWHTLKEDPDHPPTRETEDAHPYGNFTQTDRRGLGWAVLSLPDQLPWDIYYYRECANCNYSGFTESENGGYWEEVDKYLTSYVECYENYNYCCRQCEASHLTFTTSNGEHALLQVDSAINESQCCDVYGEHIWANYLHAWATSPVIYLAEQPLETTRLNASWNAHLQAIYDNTPGADGDNGADAHICISDGSSNDACLKDTRLYIKDADGTRGSYWHWDYTGEGRWSAPIDGNAYDEVTLLIGARERSKHQNEYNEAAVTISNLWIDF